MVPQLLLAMLLASVTVMLHVVGCIYVVLPAARVRLRKAEPPDSFGPVVTLTRLTCGLLVLHFVEIAVWAGAFAAAGIFSDFETSLYYSLKSYTTVGYGDVLPSLQWRLVGPIEAAAGILMLGLSTSLIVTAVNRLYNSH